MSDIYALDLDWDFIQHLADEQSVEYIRAEGVSQELLEDELAREVYEFQTNHIRDHSQPATGAVLEHEFDQVSITGAQTAIGDLLDRLRERYGRNQGREAIKELTHKALEDPASVGQEMLRAGQRLSKITSIRSATFGSGDFEKAISRYHKRVIKGRGPSLGFKELDEYFYGQLGLTFCIGAPKAGKSWFTIKAFHQNIMDDKNPYLYSLELPAEETDMRLRCMAAKVPYWKYLQNQLDPRDMEALQEASDILKDWGSYTVEKPMQGRRGAAEIVQNARDKGAEVIFIDQLQYMENRRGIAIGATNDTKDYFEVINDLRDLSDEGPIWVVHQFNRSIMSADKMPDMQQIKGSSAVEECATLALGLWASTEMKKSNLIQIGTLTSRNYGYKAWEAQMKFRNSCGIDIIGTVDE